MLPANRHLLPVIGIDIHFIVILGAPVPIPHPFIGLVFDPMDWIPKIGASVYVNSIPRGNAGTEGMLGCKAHIPMGGPFAMAPMIGHDAKDFFGSPRVKVEGSYMSGAGYMVMTCNDIGIPLSITPGKKFKPIPTLYLPTSATIPIPGGKPVIVGGPYVPDLMGMLTSLVMSFGFGALMKVGGALVKKGLTKVNGMLKKKFGAGNSLSKKLCKHGFEPVNLITGSVLYEGLDFELPGPIPIRWERSWYSDSEYTGLLGHGTHLCYDMSLRLYEEEATIGLMLPDGRVTGFPLLLAENEESYNRAEKLTLTCRGRDLYELFDHNTQLIYRFRQAQKNRFRPETLSNRAGFSIRFYYNRQHVLNKLVDTAGRELILDLDELNRITRVQVQHKGLKRVLVTYGYNEAGDLSAITDAKDQTTVIQYRNHLMVEKTDRNGQTFYWKYNGFSTGARCIHTYGDGGILEGRIEYREGYNVVTNSLGEEKLYYFDESGLCTQETDAMGNSVFHEYTEFMEPYRDIDEEGNITGYVYDARGNVTSTQLPDGAVSHYLYDEKGKLKLATDAEGNSTVYVYQEERLTAVVGADGSVTSYGYNDAGLMETVTGGTGRKTELLYDEDHNVMKMTLPGGAVASWQYDAWGRCTTATNPEMQSQRFTYDALDRVTGVRKYDGNKVSLQYNAYEQVTYAEDAQHKVRFEYTPLGSLKMREESGSRIQFNYDTEERLVSLLNEHKEAYRFRYDSRGMIIEEKGFDGLKREYLRDVAGKVIRVNRPGNRFTEYEYDLAGRLTRAEYSDGSWEIYSYNKAGQLIEAQNDNSHILLVRDAAGRVVKEIQDGHEVESSYDKLGRRIGVRSSLGTAIDIERNQAGFVSRMAAVNGDGASWEAGFRYNALGQETERLLPGGIISAFQYDQSGHPVEQRVRGGEKTLRHRRYSWNVNDRLQSMVNGLTRGVVQYGHDDFGNLAWAKYEDGQFDYRMPDKVGNLYKTKDQTDRKYGAGGRLLQSGNIKYSYDEEGNLVRKTSSEGSDWMYEWAGNGLLKRVTRPDGKEVSFEYDALGRRTAKIYKHTITRWVWDGNKILHEWKYEEKDRPKIIVDEFGDVNTDKAEPSADIVSWLFDEGNFKPAAKLANGLAQSIITDYLGTPVELYDENGKQTWSVEYDVYGKIRKRSVGEAVDCPFRYQGQYEDEETGLYYNRFRYYCPSNGVFLQKDKIGLGGGMKFYSYVKDPSVFVDIFGLNETFLGTVYRGMQSEDGAPKVYSGETGSGNNAANSLGVRPGETGMSTNIDPANIQPHRKPASHGGTQKGGVMYSLDTNVLDEHGLVAVLDEGDHGPGHVSITTKEGVPKEELGERLARTKQQWTPCT